MISYLNLKVNNSPGVLNRITNLIRKRNYNIDELNLTFGKKGYAYILIGFHIENIEIEQIKNQLEKLYDVHKIDSIIGKNNIKRNFYVYANKKDMLNNFSKKPLKIINISNKFVGIYIIDFCDGNDFIKELNKSNLKYFKKSIGFNA